MQPLNVCLSHVGTMKIVEKISEGHDTEVQEWSDRLLPLVKKPSQTVSYIMICKVVHLNVVDLSVHDLMGFS